MLAHFLHRMPHNFPKPDHGREVAGTPTATDGLTSNNVYAVKAESKPVPTVQPRNRLSLQAPKIEAPSSPRLNNNKTRNTIPNLGKTGKLWLPEGKCRRVDDCTSLSEQELQDQQSMSRGIKRECNLPELYNITREAEGYDGGDELSYDEEDLGSFQEENHGSGASGNPVQSMTDFDVPFSLLSMLDIPQQHLELRQSSNISDQLAYLNHKPTITESSAAPMALMFTKGGARNKAL